MQTVSGDKVKSLGLGSRHIGGAYSKRDDELIPLSSVSDTQEIAGIRYNLDQGINYIDVCHHYGYGKSVELIAKALLGYDREKMFINAKLEIQTSSVDEIKSSLARYCTALGTDYVDSFQIHGPMQYLDHGVVIETIHKLIDIKKARFLSISNFNKEQLQESLSWSDHPPISHEINFNLITHVNEENGVINWCEENKVKVIAYQPLKRNIIANANYPLLTQLAEKYGKTQNQLLLNRVCMHKKYLAICKSSNPKHIDENIQALGFAMEEQDYTSLDSFRPQGYQSPSYDYRGNDDTKPKIWKL